MPLMERKMKRVKSIIFLILINLIALEAFSLVVVSVIRFVKPDYGLDLLVSERFSKITDKHLENWRRSFSRQLGWQNIPGNSSTARNTAGAEYTISIGPDGARYDGRVESQPFINVYGSSFVQGDEVDDDETWAFHLQEKLDREVKNFGQNGQGIYQAFLKIQEHFAQGLVADITILGIFPADLNRVRNQWRPFLNPSTLGRLQFKPSLKYAEGQVHHVPNPVQDPDQSLTQLKALAYDLAESDYWAQRRPDFRFSFPFTYEIASNIPALFHRILAKFMKQDTWDRPDGHEILHYILENFVRSAEENETVPIILFIPNLQGWNENRQEPKYKYFRDNVLALRLPDVLVVDIADAQFQADRLNVLPFRGHLSVYGNEVVADYVMRALEGSSLNRSIAD